MMSAVQNKGKIRAPKRARILHKNLSHAVYGRPRINPLSGPPVHCNPPGWKRIPDIFYILITLPVTLPLMVVIALWIKFVSRGPLLFQQKRIGLNGRRFTLYKFRSMKMHSDGMRHENHFRHLVRTNQPMVKLDLLCDPRLLPGGCLMRAAGLDELPQLFNVLRGEMSLVGPRPCLAEELRYFSAKQRERFSVLPGLTGIWQVHGNGNATFNEMNAMDAFYIQRMSPTLDLSLILRTPLTLLRQMHAALHNHHRVAGGQARSASSEDALVTGYPTERLG